jgi:DNA recombination protein RmuC
LSTTLDIERRQSAERVADVEKTIATLSGEALRQNSQTFLQLAQESLKQFQVHAKSELDQKEKAVEHLVKPIRDALEKTEQQVRLMEQERKEAYGALHKHLETMTQTQQLLHGETRNLVQALRRPEVRGQWGEMTLKRLAELAGMVEHCDFYPQESTDTDIGRMRPDMVVRMPDGREIIVDVKTPLDAYLSAIEAADDTTRARHLEHHARKVRERVRELAAKAYWNQFKNAPDFVVLFIPGDQFLSAALDVDHALLEDALKQKIILATPTSFVALLRAVAYGWRQEQLAENADRIRELGEDLYQRLATFTEHLARIGTSLESSVGAYNKAVGSLDSKVLPGARKFLEMGVTARKTLETPAPVEIAPREAPPVK